MTRFQLDPVVDGELGWTARKGLGRNVVALLDRVDELLAMSSRRRSGEGVRIPGPSKSQVSGISSFDGSGIPDDGQQSLTLGRD